MLMAVMMTKMLWFAPLVVFIRVVSMAGVLFAACRASHPA